MYHNYGTLMETSVPYMYRDYGTCTVGTVHNSLYYCFTLTSPNADMFQLYADVQFQVKPLSRGTSSS